MIIVQDGTPMDSAMQISVIDFIHRTGGENLHIINLMSNEEDTPVAVRFHAASILHLSATIFLDPEIAKSIASAYVSILLQPGEKNSTSHPSCSNDTCRLVILRRLLNLQSQHHCSVPQAHRLLHLLSCEDVGIAVKDLLIKTCIPGISASHADEAITLLISEVKAYHLLESSNQISSLEYDHGISLYRKHLLASLTLLAQRFPPSAPALVSCCIEIVSATGKGTSSAHNNHQVTNSDDAISCLRGLLLRLPVLRPKAVSDMVQVLDSICDARALSYLLWMIGEFATETGKLYICIFAPISFN